MNEETKRLSQERGPNPEKLPYGVESPELSKGQEISPDIMVDKDSKPPEQQGDGVEINASMPRDFFAVNELTLGYKGKLTLAVRKALVALEREASRQADVPVERLRVEFLALRSRKGSHGYEWMIRPEYITSDYRMFLILYLTRARRKKRSELFP